MSNLLVSVCCCGAGFRSVFEVVSFARIVGKGLVLVFLALVSVILFVRWFRFICPFGQRLVLVDPVQKCEVRVVSLPCLNIVPRIPGGESGRSLVHLDLGVETVTPIVTPKGGASLCDEEHQVRFNPYRQNG